MSARLAPEPGATRSLRARFAAGPLARAVARADVRLYTLVRRDLQVTAVQPLVRAYTLAGESAALWYAVGLAGARLDRRNARAYRRAMATVFASQCVNAGIKRIARRSRPELEELPALVKLPTSLSFPSSHAATSFAAARGFAPLMGSRAVYLAAAAMALSRVYVGVHYPSDILVGAGLGTVVGSVAR